MWWEVDASLFFCNFLYFSEKIWGIQFFVNVISQDLQMAWISNLETLVELENFVKFEIQAICRSEL